MAIEQAEANKIYKVEIPDTVVDRACSFIDLQNDCGKSEKGMVEMEIDKAKRLMGSGPVPIGKAP
eukprot:16191634-Heterocapsa_arctica.AAC.1